MQQTRRWGRDKELGSALICHMWGTFGVVELNLSLRICSYLKLLAKRICGHVLLFAAISEAYLQLLTAICSY